MSRRPFRRPLLLLTVLTLAGCGGDGPSGPPVPVEVLVTPSLDTLVVTGGTVRFSAQVLGKKGIAQIRATAAGVVGQGLLTVRSVGLP